MPSYNPFHYIKKYVTDELGITNPAPPDVSKSPDVEQLRRLAAKFGGEYSNRVPGQEKQVAAGPMGAAQLDQTQADQARRTMEGNIGQLEAVAGGARTASDAMFERGQDAARRNAAGLAAAYSRGNPGLALRAGLAGGNQAAMDITGAAAQQKLQEQQGARDRIGQLAAAMRGADLGAASTNAGLTQDASKTNLATGVDVQKANQAAQLQQQALNNQYEIAKGNQVQTAFLAPVNSTQANIQNQLQNQQLNQQGLGGALTGLALSDERAKTDVESTEDDVARIDEFEKPSSAGRLAGSLKAAGRSLMSSAPIKRSGPIYDLSDERSKDKEHTPGSLADALAKGVRGVSFTYKPGLGDDAKHVGVIAQDVERVIPGVVKERRDGLKAIDTGQLSLANTNILSELARRLRAVESRA